MKLCIVTFHPGLSARTDDGRAAGGQTRRHELWGFSDGR